MTRTHGPLALITGGSAGLGRALVHALHDRGWTVVTDGRDAVRLAEATRDLDDVAALPGDIAEAGHRAELVRAVQDLDRGLDLLVHNASTLGRSRCRPSQDLETESLAAIWDTNAGAPHALTRALVPDLDAAKASSSACPPTRPSSTTRAGAGTARPRRRSTTSR